MKGDFDIPEDARKSDLDRIRTESEGAEDEMGLAARMMLVTFVCRMYNNCRAIWPWRSGDTRLRQWKG